jgi:hypothetical protein
VGCTCAIRNAVGGAFAALTLATVALASTPDALEAPAARLSFQVFLNDREIGFHEFTFRDGPNGRTVESEARFNVKVLFVNAFRYEHQNVERWSDGCLVEIAARTDNNGQDLAVRGSADANRFVVASSQGTAELNGCVQTFAYWNPALRNAERLLNSQTGEYLDVEVSRLGMDTTTIGSQELTIERLRLTAKDTDIEIGYDARTGEWVTLDTRLKKGRVLSYRRTPATLVAAT